ncbi:MAG: hypothetical protein HON98_05940 [Chloroflexi bacterium]|jgi:hypothetical protein|nr:hypothetical protein [Chloroflexota bacterium]MBT3670568.1 hypothetical protein [Chloroflexota bacterium]MBT4002394.1 hypothetical protein [Chloroflexota bacterium]MBT4304203.1 hypothetical protein [Chloroflexota bacterium]MBT4533438.1 hypothetical protein [Chloroflexota bacterium]
MSDVKLLMTWDILPGREEDYFEFHIRKFIPSLEGLDLALNEAWLKVYGDGPRLMAEAVIPNLKKANQVLESDEWESLNIQLEDFVENFDYKVIPALTRWQI